MGHGSPDNMNRAGLLQSVLVILHLRQVLCGSVRFSIPEEREAGVRVGTIAKDFPLPPYQLLSQEYLWMSENTGELYTTEQRMDRETLCPEETQESKECVLPHNAVVGPSRDLIQFLVVLEDINDNAPRFENGEIRLSVPEDVAAGTRFLLDEQAQDGDTGPNGEVRYHLEGSDGYFGLAVEEEGQVMMLVVEKPLDRETRAEHRMTLVASDGGFPPLSATASLTVTVTDVNDNCPSFTSEGPRSVTLPGDAPRGTAVARVVAADRDVGPNAAISYSFSPKVSERARRLFSLDSRTGHITLAQDLRSDSAEELVLKVLANGYHCPPTDTQVTVSVLPAAGQVPAIKIGFIAEHQNQTIMLPENQPPTVLALLELGGDGNLKSTSLSIEGEAPFSLSLQNGKYLLSTAKPLDYEMKREYDIAVVAVRPPAEGVVNYPYSRRVIRVLVVDVNDNAPLFPQSHYQLEVEENNRPGASLLKVSASDADSGPNGRVTYRLGRHDAAAMFKMDRATGRLSASVPLDREQQDVHTLTVLARDGGSPPLESTATVCIRVLDQNDNAPAFLTPHFVFFVPENIPALAQVGKVGVTDADDGENGNAEVRVLNGSEAFVVDNAQGTLRCTAGVDRETQDHYELYLVATDNGRPSPLTSVARVTIFVEDVNDNQPKVILPNSNLSCRTVSPSTRAGAMVAKIYAVDEDSGLNSDITYVIAARQPAHHSSPFRLDSRSGNVTLAQRVTGKDLGMHHLLVVVSDRGKPSPLHTTVWVNLLVNESAGPCHLDSVPRSLPYRLHAQTPSEAPICEPEEEGGTAKQQAQLMLLVGSAMMLASICLCVLTAVCYLRQRRRRGRWSRSGHNDIPLRLEEKCCSDEL